MKPEGSAAIRAYDYFAALSFGIVAALAAWLIVPELLPMPVAMVAGMGVGVVVALPLLGLFSYVLGGFEILVMSMQIGMLAGMSGVLVGGDAVGPVATAGAMVGLAIQLVLDVANHALHGAVGPHE